MNTSILLPSRKDNIESIKLTDFGFSLSTSNHQLVTALGTPGYTAPEIRRNQPYTSAVDIWSLGVITYILLCGYPPFPTNNEAELIRLVSTATFYFYPNEWNSISDEAKAFIKNMIVVDPKKRLTCQSVCPIPQYFIHSITQSFTHSIIHSFTHSIIQSFTHSIIQSFNHSPSL